MCDTMIRLSRKREYVCTCGNDKLLVSKRPFGVFLYCRECGTPLDLNCQATLVQLANLGVFILRRNKYDK
jgi:hypothetical protein